VVLAVRSKIPNTTICGVAPVEVPNKFGGKNAFGICLLLNLFDIWSESQKKGLLFPCLPPSCCKLSDYDCFWEWRINSSGILQTIIRQVSSSDCKDYSISAPWQLYACAWCPPPLSKDVLRHSDIVVLAPTSCPATPRSFIVRTSVEGRTWEHM